MNTFLFLSAIFLVFIIERSLGSIRKENQALIEKIRKQEGRIVDLEFECRDLKTKAKAMLERHNKLTESHHKLGNIVALLKKDILLSGVFVKNTKES